MCGITGFWQAPADAADLSASVEAMAGAIAHRGPDSSGAWVQASSGIGFGFRRLAIIDLSSNGDQPFHSPDGRWTLVFNGEIYNYPALRASLNWQWRGSSDSEVLLAALCTWGVAATLPKLVGMFAFAFWDSHERTLSLARDRFGEKPLYYGWQGGNFLFGSELAALRAYPGFQPSLNQTALGLYLQYNYVPSPYCIYENCYKLPAAHWIVLKDRLSKDVPQPYWQARAAFTAAHAVEASTLPVAAQVTELDRLLRQSLTGQRLADVPLGAFLSGGLDSSTIVAVLQATQNQPVQTFTIGFRDAHYDEAPFARAVAQHLGTTHHELYLDAAAAQALIPELPRYYNEPFADSSQLPTLLLARFARQQVKVALSGDGGDELFGGYNRYRFAPRIWQRVGWLPQSLRTGLAGGLGFGLKAAGWFVRPQRLAQWQKVAVALPSRNPAEFYRALTQHWQLPPSQHWQPPHGLPFDWQSNISFAEWQMFQDSQSYLPDDILVKVDRASMGVGLEVRVPFLDWRLVEYAWHLPLALKIRGGVGKWLLRQVLAQYIPLQLLERPKAGFAVPLADWLRGDLHDWANDWLQPSRLARYLDPEPILTRWQQHQLGQANWQEPLWGVLQFLQWADTNNL